MWVNNFHWQIWLQSCKKKKRIILKTKVLSHRKKKSAEVTETRFVNKVCFSPSKVPHHQKILLSHHKQTDMPGHNCVFVNKFFLRFKRKYEKIKRSNKQVHLFCKQSIQWLVDTFYFWIQYSCMMQYLIWSLSINCERLITFSSVYIKQLRTTVSVWNCLYHHAVW